MPEPPPSPRLLDRVRAAVRAPLQSPHREGVRGVGPQALLGHRDVKTTMITHVLNRGPASVQSPADRANL